ncbi:MAG: threonine/serine exporter family protein [Propionibacteriaceae bacterium]|jgi:uncharacterized membrane protein YjjP (DUF1212 family)|nr:threonine/serine exporter family protein [Propionibacteriaceae bacterium]
MPKGLAHHPHVPGGKNLAAESHAIVRMGKALLSAGAETYRVRLSMEQVAAALGIEWLQSQITLSEVTVTLFKGNRFRTQVGQVHSVGVNADKLSALEKLADTCRKGITPQEIEDALYEIDQRPRLVPPWMNALCASLACSAVAFLNNAWWVAITGVLVGSFLGQFLRVQLSRKSVNVYLTALAAALVAAFAYIGVTALLGGLVHDTSDIGPGYVAAVIFLAPGFPLVNAALDMLKTDMTAGMARLAYAALILASAAAALIAVTWIVGVQPNPLPPPPLDPFWWWFFSAIASWVGVAGWAVMFNTSFRGAAAAGFVGVFANLVRLLLLEFGTPAWLAATLSCFIIGLLAWFVSRPIDLAQVTIAVPAALIMVPGTHAFRALVEFSQASGDANVVLVNASAAIFTIMGMAIGLSSAKLLTDVKWIFDKRRPLGA